MAAVLVPPAASTYATPGPRRDLGTRAALSTLQPELKRKVGSRKVTTIVSCML
jgi:hypothetical protein